MNLIEGIKIEVTSAELRTMLEERRDHHKAKHAFYLEQVQNLTKGGVGESTASNDPVSSLKHSAKDHQNRMALFAYLAEHIIPDATYRLAEHDLSRLELLSHYL